MKTTINVGAAYGTPVAMKNATGEWVEVGYVTDLEANEDARSLMIEIAQRSMAE